MIDFSRRSITLDPLSDTLKQITAVLANLGIRYAIGGSLASSARSIWRTTMDVDIVAAISPVQAEAFVKALKSDCYADLDTVRRAIEAGRSFNVIQMKKVQKVDIFPAREAFYRTQLERATIIPIGEDRVRCAVTTAEDILLAKLRYSDGGEVSERQWNDIVGLLATNPELDADYVARWAAELGVTKLLERAQADARAE